jgi:translocation and assembly module TamA
VTSRSALVSGASWFGLAVLLGMLGCAHSQEKPDQPIVKSLRIEGTKHVSEGDLKSKILTSETSWWPWAEKHYFDPNAWQADLRRIERAYQAEGYYNAKVVEDQVIPQPPNAVALRVRVEEGEPTRISQINVTGLEALPPQHRDDSLSDMPIKQGRIFREEDWTPVKGEIQSKLHQLGYAEALVLGDAFVELAKLTSDIRIRAEPGQRYQFGDVFVTTNPNPRVRPTWIKEEAEAAIKKGKWFSDAALAEAQARVFRMGVFGAVKVTPGAPDRQKATLPVVVDVRESPYHTIRAGGGIGIDQLRNEVRLLTEYVNRDFYGGLRKLTLRGRVGWAFIPNFVSALQGSQSVAVKSEPIYKASAELEQPRAFFRDVRLQGSVDTERGAEQAYSFFSNRAKLGFVWQPHSSFSIFPSYNIEVDYLLSGQTTLGGRAPALFLGCSSRTDPNCFLVLSYLEQQITWDRRDDREEPRKGFYLGISFQEGGNFLGGSFDYVRIAPETRFYVSFPRRSQRFTVAAKVRLGTLRPLHNASPIVSRFFSGGDAMRGFNYRRLSPLLVVPQNPNQGLQDGLAIPAGLQGYTVPIGGNGMAETSLELRYNIATNWVLASFLDTGFVTPEDIRTGVLTQGFSYFTKNMQYAVGAGIRYRTPVGPVRVDIAHLLNIGPPLLVLQSDPPLNPPQASSGFFGLFGGQRSPNSAGFPESTWTIHISLGEAF